MDFVDHVDLEAPRAGRVNRLFEKLGHFIDATVRRGIELKIVDKPPLINLCAGLTDATRGRRDTGFTIKGLRQDTRKRRFTHTSRAGKKPGVVQSLRCQGVRQGADNVILTDQRIERARAPFTRKDQIAHKFYRPQTEIKEPSLTSALIPHDYGCFVPDLTRFAAEPCEGARQAQF